MFYAFVWLQTPDAPMDVLINEQTHKSQSFYVSERYSFLNDIQFTTLLMSKFYYLNIVNCPLFVTSTNIQLYRISLCSNSAVEKWLLKSDSCGTADQWNNNYCQTLQKNLYLSLFHHTWQFEFPILYLPAVLCSFVTVPSGVIDVICRSVIIVWAMFTAGIYTMNVKVSDLM